ncbi:MULTISPECIES: hypothetical protein [unclassified Pseudoalteromonas]|uniref:hypothetical protein n=1 Tax=unclassified Pseudoalteromonas TaxID=194690 RepID=UPI003014FD45
MPHQYQVETQTKLTTHNNALTPLVLSHWPQLFNWQKPEAIYFTLIPKQQAIGSSAIIVHPWGEAEITVYSVSEEQLKLSLHISDEHMATINLMQSQQGNAKQLKVEINGRVNIPFIGSFAALFMQRYLQQLSSSALNHMNSQYKMQASHDG